MDCPNALFLQRAWLYQANTYLLEIFLFKVHFVSKLLRNISPSAELKKNCAKKINNV